ncbi:hypothetical protein [Numidum massiliense]|uniref:hypothetical protein n=1 Tax=Numidum massiliense TaxID=1522315 RepID=UPI0009E8FF93|nr:hypothetical protein [Numidum massiliense]
MTVKSVQGAVRDLLDRITVDNFKDVTDFALFREQFMQLNGFAIDGIDFRGGSRP